MYLHTERFKAAHRSEANPRVIFTGRANTVVGVDVTCEIGGDAFLPSFTDGDNTLVVATDSMKNFIQRHLASYEGTTAEDSYTMWLTDF